MAMTVCRDDRRRYVSAHGNRTRRAGGRRLYRGMAADEEILISAATIAEALIVAARRNVREEMTKLIDNFGFDVVGVTAASARRIASAYERWGKGMDATGLNFGDCFAYEVARENDCPLLYVGDDFARTDVKRADRDQSIGEIGTTNCRRSQAEIRSPRLSKRWRCAPIIYPSMQHADRGGPPGTDGDAPSFSFTRTATAPRESRPYALQASGAVRVASAPRLSSEIPR